MNPFDPTPLQRPVHLPPGRALRLSPAHGEPGRTMHRWWPARRRPRLQLKVLRGGAWVTWPGCEDDLFLRAGQSIWLPEPVWNSPLATVDGVLIEAEPRLSGERAVVMLVPAAVTEAPRGAPSWLARLRGT